MYTLDTQLTNFKYDSIHRTGHYDVTWYKLIGDNGICLNQNELTLLINYVSNNKINFNNQNHSICSKDETPGCGIYDTLPPNSNNPNNLLLKRVPQISSKGGKPYPCMDILLLNANGTTNHNYNLPFDLIGKIN